MNYISGLGFIGFLLVIIAIMFLFVSACMWYLVPWWIRSIKNSVKNLHNTPIVYETNKTGSYNYNRELTEIIRQLERLNENINNLKYLPH